MIDLDTFRTALHEPDHGRPPALDEIMNAGRRLRFKRRVATGTVVAAALVVAAGSAAAVWRAQAPPLQAASSSSEPHSSDGNVSWGQAVDTGMSHGKRAVVVTAFHNNNPAYPDIKVGIRACAATDDGQLEPCHNTFDEKAPDRSPGFHSIGMPTTINDVDLPMFGYYVGPAATITVKARGTVVKAQTATWSEDHNVVFFWFPLDRVTLTPDKNDPSYKGRKVTGGEYPSVSDWSAYDAAGTSLPVGNPSVVD
jgi:hypothetical protein